MGFIQKKITAIFLSSIIIIIMKSNSEETNVIKKDFSEYGQILALEISPFNLSQDLILIGFETIILIGQFKIDDEIIGLDIIAKFIIPSRCLSFSISSETSISILPNNIIFAASGVDHKIRIFKSDLRGDDICKILNDHRSYINDVKFDPDNNFLASASDDNTAKLFRTDSYKCVAIFQLVSPGMSVCWHKDDSSKLLVAEKIGLIRFYNVETQTPILSLDYGKPLSNCHWAPSDSQLVASIQLGELLLWDLSKPCVPMSNNLIFTESGGYLKFSPFGELIAAINNLDSTLKVVNLHSNHLKLSIGITLPSNVTWHSRIPIVCVGDYQTLLLCKVT